MRMFEKTVFTSDNVMIIKRFVRWLFRHTCADLTIFLTKRIFQYRSTNCTHCNDISVWNFSIIFLSFYSRIFHEFSRCDITHILRQLKFYNRIKYLTIISYVIIAHVSDYGTIEIRSKHFNARPSVKFTYKKLLSNDARKSD